jgi:D-alanyl-D-alanine carboxypeptidase (penicillin-binding protein 5/6)
VVVSKNASSMGGSQVFLEENGVYKVSELIKSISVASANDSCVAMAEKLYGSEEEFVKVMNNKCTELGLNNTKFSNCTGLPKPEQYSTAKDVSVIFNNLIKHDKYFEISNIWMENFIHPEGRITEMSNTNKLVRFYDGCDSGKTGFTSEAGHCLTASAKRNGLRLIAVVISAPDSKTRFNEVSSMLNYGFSNYECKKIIDKNEILSISAKVEGGKKDNIKIIPQEDFYSLTKKGEKRSYEINFTPNSKIKAPINVGDYVGKISIFENGIEIFSTNVLSNEEVLSKTYFDVLKDISHNFNLI